MGMPRCLHKLHVGARLHRTIPNIQSRLSHSIQVTDSLSWAQSEGATTTSTDNPQDAVRARQISDLLDSLTRIGNASRVWAYYVSLLHSLQNERLPLEVHQEVLRKCAPSTAEVRTAAVRRLLLGNIPSNPHVYEGRFRTIVRNIRAMGAVPSLEDYHFILEQFAAVGHYTGTSQVYSELRSMGLRPTTKTIGLCLQSLAHRLTLPVRQRTGELLSQEINRMHRLLLNDMQRYNIGFASVNFDISVRILKHSIDKDTCQHLLKVGYGIDLAYPDRPVLDLLRDHSDTSTDPDLPVLPQPQRFTTNALNTVIDMLGRLGDISKMVQAFEVLTKPLPPQAAQHFSSSFDDEDDDYSTSTLPPVPISVSLPHAEPNTTTYNTLIRYLSRAGHPILARHYILQAMELDRLSDRRVRGQIAYGIPLEQVLAPHFAINRGTLLPAFGEANRDKNTSLMRWIHSKLPAILRRKRNDLIFYSDVKKRRDDATPEAPDHSEVPTIQSSKDQISSPLPPPSIVPPPVPLPGPVYSRSAFEVPSSRPGWPISVLDIDLDAPPSLQLPVKYLNIDLHLQILRRDIAEIESFSRHVADIVGRTTQRVKERLGRRVWLGRDVYLRSEEQRAIISRQSWLEQVNYKPRLNQRRLEANIFSFSRRRDPAPHLSRPAWSRGLRTTPSSFSKHFTGCSSAVPLDL